MYESKPEFEGKPGSLKASHTKYESKPEIGGNHYDH